MFWTPNRCYYNFGINHKTWFQKLMSRRVHYIHPLFYPFHCSFLSEVANLLLSFSFYLKNFLLPFVKGSLLVTNSPSFLSSEDAFIFPTLLSWRVVSLDTIHSFLFFSISSWKNVPLSADLHGFQRVIFCCLSWCSPASFSDRF